MVDKYFVRSKKLKCFFCVLVYASPNKHAIKFQLSTLNMYATKNHNRRRNSPRRQARSPFCKVCYDAGKSKEEYSSHYVKDKPGPHGKVCCPYLLSLTCRYCHKTGHTPNHCPEVKAKECRHSTPSRRHASPQRENDDGFTMVTPARRPRRSHVNAPRKPAVQENSRDKIAKPRSMWDRLAQITDEEDRAEAAQIEEQKAFPTLGAAKTSAPVLTGWSTMAAKPPPVKVQAPAPVAVTRVSSYTPYTPLKDGGKSWADMMDEEEEEEEEFSNQPIRDAWYDTDEEDLDDRTAGVYRGGYNSDEDW